MASSKAKQPKTAAGRGSPEAVEKRRAARAFNALVARAQGGGVLDGRTEKRRQRLVKELREGRGGKPLSPIDVLTHAGELMSLGETLASLKKQGVKGMQVPPTPELIEAALRVREAYTLPDEAFKLIGIELPAPASGRRRGRRSEP